mmetsp:Transcript_17135/g.25962  ORF Transcript_17135/g.25962 Transcript_17135/m.25962 type:complete len:329 (-) Transcript_17135:3977-4963(-)
MKILLTGASGFLGQHFLYALMDKTEGNEIFAIFRSSETFSISSYLQQETSKVASIVHIHKLDLTNIDDVDSYFETHGTFDVCFHLAALSSPRACHENPQYAKLINIPTHFIKILKDTPVIALSTDQVYCGTQAPYLESAKTGPVNIYAETKLNLESLLLARDSCRTKPAICLRSSIILGPLAPFGDAHSTFLHFCKSREGQMTTFYSDEIRSVVNVNDVTHILLHFHNAVKDGTFKDMNSRAYNMGGPERISRMDMAVAVAEHCGLENYKNCFISAEKAKIQSSGEDALLLSPLDISMCSSDLEELVGIKFHNLASTVRQVFPISSNE